MQKCKSALFVLAFLLQVEKRLFIGIFEKTQISSVAMGRIVWYYIFDICEHFNHIMLRLVTECLVL